MVEVPDYFKNFAAFHVYEAIYHTVEKVEQILLEVRSFANEETSLFTIINDQPVRVGSVHELVYSRPELISLSISHVVRLLWNDEMKKAEIVEIFSHSQDPGHPQVASLQLRLNIEGKTYETTICDTLQDAIEELHEMTRAEAQWLLYACYSCRYSGYARDYSVSDREYWCYRDVPDAYEEIKSKGKYASSAARFAGNYFVDAFHMCSAWQPVILISDQHT
jgi:hypothetical protein